MLSASLPRPQPTTIDRPRLMHTLARWHSLRLIRIVAPAGFGKTTFAASWLHALDALPADEKPHTAWLALDAPIDDEHFVHLVIEQLAACTPDLQHLPTVHGSGSSPGKVLLLCKLLRERPQPIILVVDNAHLLAEAAHAAVQQLIDAAPEHLHLMLLSRAPLELRVADLILQDAVATLDERALAFDHDEFTRFIRAAEFDVLDADTLGRIEAQTHGWIAGLKLLAHHYKYAGARRPGEAVDGAGASAMRFFLAKLIEAFSPEEQRVLHAAALLPWVTPALLGVLFECAEDDCARSLRSIARRFTFLMPYADAEGNLSCRLHPLLRDFLHDAAVPAATRTDMLRRAAVWMLERGDVDALLNLLDAEQIASVADPLAARMRIALLDYDITALQRWLRSVPPALLARHAHLSTIAAWTDCFSIRPEFAAALERAEHAIDRTPETAPELRAELLVLRGLQQMGSGATSVLVPLIAQIEPLVADAPSLAAGYLHAFRGWAMTEPQNPDAHIHEIQRAADIFERIGFHYGAIESTVSLGFLKRRAGNAAGAIHSMRTAEQLLGHSSWSLAQIAIMVQHSLGEQLYLTNQIEQARHKLNNAVRINAYENLLPEFGYLATLMIELCDLAEGRAGSPGPDDVFAWNAALQRALPQTLGMIATMRILRDFRRGAPTACRDTVEQLGILPDQLSPEHPDSLWLAVLSGMVLSGRIDAALTPLLDSAAARCRAENFLSMALQVRVLRILHAQALDDDTGAFDLAAPLFEDIERTGLQRLVLDFPALSPLLKRHHTPFAQKLLTHMPDADGASAFELSRQELHIVRMLLSGHTTEGVAQGLSLSMETIRSHLRRIYRKMNVHRRDEMLNAARAAGLHR